MKRPATTAKTINDPTDVSADGKPQPSTGPEEAAAAAELSGACGRGVLDGAFAVLEALARADGGMGLTALAHRSGLAKTSAYRLAEQLVSLGAVQRIDHRYFIGARIGRIGQWWQPDPVLRRAAQTAVHTLALQAGATASLQILHEDRIRMICATARHDHAYMPHPADRESAARTATGRVLYATQPDTDVALPGSWTPRNGGNSARRSKTFMLP